jgi:PAS domain S-box-containing protein
VAAEFPEQLFRLAVDSSPSGIVMVDRNGTIMLVNRLLEEQFGYTRDELIGQSIELLVPGRFRSSHAGDRGRYFTDARVRPMGKGRDLYGVRKDGSEFPVEIGLNPIRSEGGMLVLASVVDITERKRAEEQFRLAVEASPSGMLMVDERGSILLVNAQIEQQFGYSREELLGQPVEMLLPAALRARHCEQRTAFFAHPEPRQMGKGRDLFGLRKDGREIPVEIGLNPIRTAEGLRVLASVVDITERKKIEERLRQTERVAELGTLASGMAHEIGTPMNVILGRAEFLMRKTGDDTIKKGLGTIVTQVERITKIMNQLLTFARRRPSELGPLELRKTIEDSLEILQERLRAHRVQVETDFTRQVPNVHADPDQMSQVLLNLFINAVHAMPDGGTLRVGLTEAGGQAVLTITDTGCGISKEDLSKIFAPFFTTKEVGKGTGLGLTVVQGIIQEHGGTIAVDSEPGKGTTFTITLPLSASP